MTEVYNESKYYTAVDCVIFGYQKGELHLLLYPRGFEPAKGKWSLMGGFVKDDESADDAARRVLKRTTGLHDVYLEQVAFFTHPLREKSARVISLSYYAMVRIDEYDSDLVREHGAHWWPINKLPSFIFDHREIVNKALAKLQVRASVSVLGEDLLSDKFTILQLRKLYEAIFQREFDSGNFRKKILATGLLEKLAVKDTSESRKGAFYYKLIENDLEKTFDRLVKF